MKHKHAELIKAWADGAEIQHKCNLGWMDVAQNNPHWLPNTEYRIKPEQPMSPEHLPKYIATNGVKPMEGGGGGGSQPECDWTTDTPVPPFKYFDSPEYKIAQPEQEPVCDKDPYYCGYVRCQLGKVCKNTAPPKREWVGLTDEEIESSGKTDKVMLAQFFTSIESIDAMDDPIAQTMNLVIRQQGFDFARAIEAKLKEKNA